MTRDIITIDHVRTAGMCVNGARVWFVRHDLNFRRFLREGLDADTLLETGDAMAKRVVEHARHQHTMPEQR